MQNKNSKSGYIVFTGGGSCPVAYGACEEWYPTYDAAMENAMSCVGKPGYDEILVYEGEEELMHGTHIVPVGEAIFSWYSYKR